MKKVLWALSLALLIGAGLYVALPPGHVPAYDAALTRLAETEREGFCTGFVFLNSGSAADGEECRALDEIVVSKTRSKLDPRLREPMWVYETRSLSTEVDLLAADDAFCEGIVFAGWDPGVGNPVEYCLSILENYELWPTYDPGLTNFWSEKFPYPGAALVTDLTGGLS
jgi:hypothetical protein